jgi:hypothetical protein
MQATIDHGSEFSKWMELRAKTDRQLAAFLNKTLASGLRLALAGAETDAPELYSQAHHAYSEVRRLLPGLREVTISERRRLDRELARLGRLLDEAEMAGQRAGAACS